MNKEYFNKYHQRRKKFQNNKCKNCGKDITKLNKGKNPSERRTTCIECGKRNKWEKGEYVFRVLVKGKKKTPVYGVTIPKSIIEKYNLLGKTFKINVSPFGKFILYTKIKQKGI
jgi:hypothetical protein